MPSAQPATSKKKASKKAANKKTTKKATRKRKGSVEAKSRGLTAAQVAPGELPAKLEAVRASIEAVGGQVIGSFRDPLGGFWQVLASLPIDEVEPTPFQRDLSATHVKRLGEVIDRLDRFVDPIVAVPDPSGGFWSPNGFHRLMAMRQLGAKSIVALVLPETDVAFQILALNTEKAHNVKEKSLEVIRMARLLAELDDQPEKKFAVQFEEAAYLTMGVCYERRGRFSGGGYQSVLKRIDEFLPEPISETIVVREARATRVLEVDDRVAEVVKGLKEKGFDSPYLKNFVIARVNPLRFKRGATGDFEPTMEKMLQSLEKFDLSKVKQGEVAAVGGG